MILLYYAWSFVETLPNGKKYESYSDRLIAHFYQNRAAYCKVSPFTISGPEGLRSLDLTLRKRTHYPLLCNEPKITNIFPLMLITHQKQDRQT